MASTHASVNGETRIMIGSLVREIERDHCMMRCPRDICGKTVRTNNRFTFIVGEKDPYRTDLAIKNYRDLHTYLTEEVFKGDRDLPCFMNDFLSLLITNPLGNVTLICRHYATLSTSYQMVFVRHPFWIPRVMNYAVRSSFYRALEKVQIPEGLEIAIQDNELLKREFEYAHRGIGGWKVKTVSFGHFLRTLLFPSSKRLQVEPQLVSYEELIQDLLLRFPTVLVEIQRELFEANLLLDMCISPTDPLLH